MKIPERKIIEVTIFSPVRLYGVDHLQGFLRFLKFQQKSITHQGLEKIISDQKNNHHLNFSLPVHVLVVRINNFFRYFLDGTFQVTAIFPHQKLTDHL